MGKVITFYSYKGGTGRSMLLANMAWLLATNGERLLVIDWDLEAPGLHRYFKPFLVDPDMAGTDGLIDIVWTLATKGLSHESRSSSPRPPELDDVAVQIDLEDYISPLKWDFPSRGGIDFIGAGRQGVTYSERVNTFDWKRFYQMGGGRWLDRMKATWTNDYDFVLIDSRTGVSDTSGICTMQMPDALVACLTLNRQSIEGVAAILHAVRAWRTGESGGAGERERRPVDLYPVVTRIENSEQRKLDRGRKLARELLQPFLPASERYPRQYWDEMEITYRPFYAYEEVLAAFGDEVGAAASAKSLTSETEGIGRRIVGRTNLAMQSVTEDQRKRVLADYALGSEPQPSREAVVTGVRESGSKDSDFLRGIYAKEVRWRRGGYNWRNLLSRRELQLITQDDRTQFGREMSFYHQNSELFPLLRDKANSGFFVLWGGLVAVAILWFSRLLSRLDLLPPDASIATPLFPLLVMAVFTMFLIRLLISYGSAQTPYGVRFIDVLSLGILGPFAPHIRDFEPADSTPRERS